MHTLRCIGRFTYCTYPIFVHVERGNSLTVLSPKVTEYDMLAFKVLHSRSFFCLANATEKR